MLARIFQMRHCACLDSRVSNEQKGTFYIFNKVECPLLCFPPFCVSLVGSGGDRIHGTTDDRQAHVGKICLRTLQDQIWNVFCRTLADALDSLDHESTGNVLYFDGIIRDRSIAAGVTIRDRIILSISVEITVSAVKSDRITADETAGLRVIPAGSVVVESRVAVELTACKVQRPFCDFF